MISNVSKPIQKNKGGRKLNKNSIKKSPVVVVSQPTKTMHHKTIQPSSFGIIPTVAETTNNECHDGLSTNVKYSPL